MDSARATAAPASAPMASQTVEISTDVVKATLDTQGGSLVRVELLKHLTTETHGLMDPLMRLVGLKAPSGFKPEPVVVFDAASYRPESGLIGVPGADGAVVSAGVAFATVQLTEESTRTIVTQAPAPSVTTL